LSPDCRRCSRGWFRPFRVTRWRVSAPTSQLLPRRSDASENPTAELDAADLTPTRKHEEGTAPVGSDERGAGYVSSVSRSLPSLPQRLQQSLAQRSCRTMRQLNVVGRSKGVITRILAAILGCILLACVHSNAQTPAADLAASELTGQTFASNSTLRLQFSAEVRTTSTSEQETLETHDEIVAMLSVGSERVQVVSWTADDTQSGWSLATVLFPPPSNTGATPEQLIIQLRDMLTIRPNSLSSTAVMQYANVSSMRVGNCRDAECVVDDEIVSIQSCMERDCLWLIPVVGFFLICWAVSASVACYYCGNCKRKPNGVAQILQDQDLTKNAAFTRHERQIEEEAMLKVQAQQSPNTPLSPSRRNSLADLKLQKRMSVRAESIQSAIPIIPVSTSPSTLSTTTRSTSPPVVSSLEQLRAVNIDLGALQPTVLRAGALSPIAADEYESDADGESTSKALPPPPPPFPPSIPHAASWLFLDRLLSQAPLPTDAAEQV
jgi:hypothetical protein